ncbi:LysR substrate-binding domain-containing protein [Rhizorhabdus dicambivorans]|uniref:LysR family transcriptional regulator n=1 Tax=Rhizorhabdus dicambivorans TaxID=1850238 RepID=A0A2A4FRB5_9SPHN|nr:LysR substrate-binding domain-containing protein [Rhizorhabdus dicambivorans]ATE63824.1 LysR family transcriptional regulator [Rhizorhabdus dicambivorans]PCE40659.1 LysR family transcriptional regulator [Rhizorhabdus dicambivorans]
MLDTKAVRSFIALSEDLHFTRTADRLAIAQSALSSQIRRLEDVVGAPLLHRRKRAAVSLTRTGEIFLAQARAAIAQLDRAERIGQLAARGEAGPVEIGYIFSAAICGILPAMLRVLRDQLPLLQLRPSMMETPQQIAAIADAKLDVGLIRPRSNYPEAVKAIPLYRETTLLALAASHPLAARDEIRAADLAGESFINPQFHANDGLGTKLRQLAELGGFALDPITQVNDFVTAACMAAGGHGVVLAPHSLRNITIEGLIFREIVDYRESLEIALAYRVDGSSAPALSILELVRELQRQFACDSTSALDRRT